MEQQLKDAMRSRHTVRKYKDQVLPDDIRTGLENRVSDLNGRLGLAISLVSSDKDPLNTMGKFFLGGKGVKNFFILASESSKQDESLGYASADLMLFAQTLGLNTWWIGGTFNKKYIAGLAPDKNVVGIVVVGYGEESGKPHKSKPEDKVSSYSGDAPEWFKKGIEAALLAPTALNRQQFNIAGDGNKVRLTYQDGFLGAVDKGIVKYHFELGAGKENFSWE